MGTWLEIAFPLFFLLSLNSAAISNFAGASLAPAKFDKKKNR